MQPLAFLSAQKKRKYRGHHLYRFEGERLSDRPERQRNDQGDGERQRRAVQIRRGIQLEKPTVVRQCYERKEKEKKLENVCIVCIICVCVSFTSLSFFMPLSLSSLFYL